MAFLLHAFERGVSTAKADVWGKNEEPSGGDADCDHGREYAVWFFPGVQQVGQQAAVHEL